MKEMEKLEELLELYADKKEVLDALKKETDAYNKKIKELMNQLKVKEFTTKGGNKAKISVAERFEFIDIALINKIKELELEDIIIKTKEYVDTVELENAIYNGKIDAKELSECQIKKHTVTLRISKEEK